MLVLYSLDFRNIFFCLQIAKQPTEDLITFACRVNSSCVEFELGKLSEKQFKCLIYACGIKSENDVETRTRFLSKIEERSNITLEQLSEECKHFLNLEHGNQMIESISLSQVNEIKQRRSSFGPIRPVKCNQSRNTQILWSIWTSRRVLQRCTQAEGEKILKLGFHQSGGHK